jgi:hypothetical protein
LIEKKRRKKAKVGNGFLGSRGMKKNEKKKERNKERKKSKRKIFLYYKL